MIGCMGYFHHYLLPARKASPPVTTESPVSILKVLVFPAPLTPSRPKHCRMRGYVYVHRSI